MRATRKRREILCQVIYIYPQTERGFPGGTVVKNPPANAGDARDAGSIPGSGQGSLAATVHGVAKSQT